MSNADKVAFRKPETEALARDLLGGKTPTPARVRDLLRELDTRRKEPVIVDTAAEPTDIAPPGPDPDLTFRETASTITKTAEDILHDAPDEVQKDVVQEYLGQFNQYDARVRERVLQQPLGNLRRGSRLATLSEAAEALLEELDEAQRDRVRQIADENGWPTWVVVLGAVGRAADLQELASGDMKPEWLNQPERREHAPGVVAKCERCGAVIPNARRGQSACCNHHGSGHAEHTPGCPLEYMKEFNGAWVDTRR